MIVRDGYHGLSMDRIAEEIEYSKGTIYQHFSCKEDILMASAIVNQTMERRLDLFQRAAAYPGRSRERMTAIGAASEVFFECYPDHIHTEHTIRISSIREKTSEERRVRFETCKARCSEVVRGVIRDAVAAGDLRVLPDYGVNELAFGLWAITFGGYSIAVTSPSLTDLGIHDPLGTIRGNCIRLLDGAGWKPLSSDEDLTSLIEPIKRQLVGAEIPRVEAPPQLLSFFCRLIDLSSIYDSSFFSGRGPRMSWLAIRMLTGDRAKFFGLVFGVTFATFLMSQQVSVFVGIIARSASQIVDVRDASIWVMDPRVRHFDEAPGLPASVLKRVRGVAGVLWAVRFYKGQVLARIEKGLPRNVIIEAVDDSNLVERRRT